MIRHAYLNADNFVVQVTVGELLPEQHDMFLHDYGILFGATSCVRVEDDRAVWIGGSYTDGEFTPPPAPEPLPEVITETII
jgi:hypothetical protein